VGSPELNGNRMNCLGGLPNKRVQSGPSFQLSFPAGRVRTRTSEAEGSSQSKGGKFTPPYVQETLGLKLRRE